MKLAKFLTAAALAFVAIGFAGQAESAGFADASRQESAVGTPVTANDTEWGCETRDCKPLS
ncbi:hypothetical protein ACLF6K_23505 [Streptomyces xanthophaeus]|uniref:hypothetical protein n=1 Tax=Streptomyces xanthophaeus TaxID=67385 RepID=UPI00398FAFD1